MQLSDLAKAMVITVQNAKSVIPDRVRKPAAVRHVSLLTVFSTAFVNFAVWIAKLYAKWDYFFPWVDLKSNTKSKMTPKVRRWYPKGSKRAPKVTQKRLRAEVKSGKNAIAGPFLKPMAIAM